MRSRIRALGLVLAVLLATGLAGDRLSRRTWERMRARQPALDAATLQAALGQGITIGLLGGFRAIVADFLWLANNAAWERHDLPASQTLIRLVTAIDPRPRYFWINGARMIAYDMPVWRIEAAGGFDAVPPAVRRRLESDQATVALGYLENGLVHHPRDPLLLVEMANIRLRRLEDVAGAAALYRLAAEQPRAPYYAARIYAGLLETLGRPREALDWLVRVHRDLPADDPAAMPGIVLGRIRDLEEALGVPEAERYRPEGGAASGPAGRQGGGSTPGAP